MQTFGEPVGKRNEKKRERIESQRQSERASVSVEIKLYTFAW